MIRAAQTPYLGILLLILIIKAIIITAFVLTSDVGLSPDEAQYWTWSRHLDWGYYSKPPGIAWQIFAGTYFFGDSILGVRFFSILYGILQPLAIYLLARKSQLPPQTSFWAALALALSPLGVISSMLAITDVGMIFFWTLGCAVIAHALDRRQKPDAVLLGMCILLGALFKWPIYLLWVFLLVLLPIYPFLRSHKLILGVVISLIGLLPSFTWNIEHGWVTWRHVFASINGSSDVSKSASQFFHGNFPEFLGAQAILVSPILFILMAIALIVAFKRRKELSPPLFFCAVTTASILCILAFASFFKKIQGNWGDYAYPTGFVMLSWLAFEATDWAKRWIYVGIALSLILIATALSIPTLQSHDLMGQIQIPYRINPFRHNIGWNNLAGALKSSGYEPDRDFLFSSKYQTSSILCFYGPEQKRAYFLNLFNVRKNQFSFWPSMADEQIGKDGFYVVVENQPHLKEHFEKIDDYIARLKPSFQKVEFAGSYPLFYSYGVPMKEALIFRCEKFNGIQPSDPDKY